jgi:hypothetical protein
MGATAPAPGQRRGSDLVRLCAPATADALLRLANVTHGPDRAVAHCQQSERERVAVTG